MNVSQDHRGRCPGGLVAPRRLQQRRDRGSRHHGPDSCSERRSRGLGRRDDQPVWLGLLGRPGLGCR